jgi:hypothetical protein
MGHVTRMREMHRVGKRGLDSTGMGQGPVADSCEHSTEPSSSIKGEEFLDYLSDY